MKQHIRLNYNGNHALNYNGNHASNMLIMLNHASNMLIMQATC